MQSRRDKLQQVSIRQTTHAGLWLDKYLKEQSEGGGKKAKTGHFDEVAKKPTPDAYPAFFTRWQRSLEQAGAVTRKAQSPGRLILGLGGESVLENSITLHHTYGVPYIPGSALKGLAASYARNRLEEPWEKSSDAYKTLFGDTAVAGYVTFFDALYIPSSARQNSPLWPDVITVHHQEYYRGEENSPPADWDNPIPVPFLSATGSYLIALHGAENWVKAAFEILTLALVEEGIGAKTSSGYGRMIVEGDAPGDDKLDASMGVVAGDPEQATVASFLLRLEQMPNHKVAGEIHGVYQEWQKRSDISDTSKRKIAQAILDKVESAGRTKKSAKKKWFQELQSFTVEHSPTEEK